jgi:large subunit ribosomal protein L22
MEAKAHLRYARISPRKVKIVCDLIRGKDTKLAAAILKQTPQSRVRADAKAAAQRGIECGE